MNLNVVGGPYHQDHNQTHCLNRHRHPLLHHLRPLDYLQIHRLIRLYKIMSTTESIYQSQREEYKIDLDLTFETFVSGLALRAGLIPFFPLVLIARPANRESTLIASNKGLPIHSNLNLISTDHTYLSTQFAN